jgi:cytochrome c556
MSATLITLVDGQVVASDAEEWRHETLARHVLAKPLDARREWLSEFEKRHGAHDAEQLRATMKALHEKAKAERLPGVPF